MTGKMLTADGRSSIRPMTFLSAVAVSLIVASTGACHSRRRSDEPLLPSTSLPAGYRPTANSSVSPPGVFEVARSVAASPCTATRLGDGRVLVTESRGLGVAGTSELFDPATGTVAQAGQMLGACGDRSDGYQTIAILLLDGRVLMIGTGRTYTDLELYDPASGTFAAGGTLPGPAVYGESAGLLQDGRVLIVGGAAPDGWATSAWIYDPEDGKFVATGAMATGRAQAQLVLLRDGRVLVCGGDQGYTGLGQASLASAEIYDPATGTFTTTGSMSTARTAFTATLLADGRVLVAGGHNPDESRPAAGESFELATAEIYEPSGGKFTPTGSMSTARSTLGNMTATLLRDGRVLVAGGDPTGTADLYDPAQAIFTPAGSVGTSSGQVAAALVDGRVLFPGSPSMIYRP
jgi:hypothetical protein